MDRRAFGAGLLGWTVPGIIVLPILGGHESAGGEAALGAFIVWFGLRVVGCAVGGAIAAASGRKSAALPLAFQSGLAGVALAWVAAVGIEIAVGAFVPVLHLGGLALLVPLPFVLGYGVGFGLIAALSSPGVTGPS